MSLGADYKQDGQGFVIVKPQGSFGANDALAYVISLGKSIGTTQVQMILAKEESGGVESTIFSKDTAISNPSFTELANKIPRLGDIMSVYGADAGTYRLEMSDGHTILAKADFTYTG